MKNFKELYIKYGMGEVILPPPPEKKLEEVKIPKESPSLFLSRFVLEEGDDPLDPKIYEKYEPEKYKWRQNKLPKEVEEDLKKVVEDLGGEEGKTPSSGESETVAPPKKATLSPDTLLKLCSDFYKMAIG